MEDHPNIPEAVSYRQLSAWLTAATEQAPLTDQPDAAGPAASTQQERFRAQLQSWSSSSQQLLAMLQAAGPALGEGRSARQLMALGALQAHLAMALQAGAASGC